MMSAMSRSEGDAKANGSQRLRFMANAPRRTIDSWKASSESDVTVQSTRWSNYHAFEAESQVWGPGGVDEARYLRSALRTADRGRPHALGRSPCRGSRPRLGAGHDHVVGDPHRAEAGFLAMATA